METLLHSEPHRIIERDVDWNDFIDYALSSQCLRIQGPWNPYYGVFWPERYAEAHNLAYEPAKELLRERVIGGIKFFGEHNKTIKYGQGVFHLNRKVYDTRETGETEPGLDGIEVPVRERLNTFRLVPVYVQMLVVKCKF